MGDQNSLEEDNADHDQIEIEWLLDTLEDVELVLQLSGIQKVEKLHHHKHVENEGVVTGGPDWGGQTGEVVAPGLAHEVRSARTHQAH